MLPREHNRATGEPVTFTDLYKEVQQLCKRHKVHKFGCKRVDRAYAFEEEGVPGDGASDASMGGAYTRYTGGRVTCGNVTVERTTWGEATGKPMLVALQAFDAYFELLDHTSFFQNHH